MVSVISGQLKLQNSSSFLVYWSTLPAFAALLTYDWLSLSSVEFLLVLLKKKNTAVLECDEEAIQNA